MHGKAPTHLKLICKPMSVETLLKEGKVIPEDAKLNFSVTDFKVAYGGKDVQAGNTLAPSDTPNAPDVVTWNATSAFYTLIKTDPDAPSRTMPAYREFVHWVRTNIPGNDIAAGEDIATYVGAAPPHSSGPHLYAHLLYQHDKPLTEAQIAEGKEYFKNRGGLKAHQWAQQAGLVGPVAAVAYKAEWDASCDAAHEALGFVPPPQFQSPKQKAKAQ